MSIKQFLSEIFIFNEGERYARGSRTIMTLKDLEKPVDKVEIPNNKQHTD